MRNDMDDVERLLGRLDRASPPAELTARVLARTIGREQRPRVAWPWCVAGLVALIGLVLTGYLLGASLASSDGLDVLEGVATDLSLLGVAPGDVLAALGEVVPWPLVGLAALSAGVLTLASGRALTTELRG
jgi:hypothetical protein